MFVNEHGVYIIVQGDICVMHAIKACNLLIASGAGFNDWVVTTAFYAALHLVHDDIFKFI